MLFHTAQFALFFLVFLLFYLPVRRTRWGVPVIVVFSSIFYGSWDWRFLPLLWITIVVDFLVGRSMGKTIDDRKRKWLLWVSLSCNLGILGYFKYWNFVIHTVLGTSAITAKLARPEIVLPLGISFYIFQSLSYIIDVYRRKQAPVAGLLDFAAFVTFFPHLIAGPIQRVQQLVPQILKPDAITVTRIASGVFLFSIGFLRKSLADLLAAFHNPVFSGLDKADPAAVVTAVFSFGFQIYLDFAGYSEMAVGLARVLGIDLIDNFQGPYLATSFREFWRRWHISLSMWLRDYLYISLGGSREGLARQAANLVLTMTVCGLWHGAGWNFVLWGFLHGCYLAINTLWNRVIGDRIPKLAGGIAGWLITFVVANYTWIYFRLATFDAAMLANRKIGEWIAHPALPTNAPRGVFLVIAAVFVMDGYQRMRNGFVPGGFELTTFRALRYGVATGVFLMAGLILNLGQPTLQFIYFQF